MSNAFVIKGVDFSDNAVTQVELINVIPCTSISLSKSSITVTSLDNTTTLTATVLPADCTETVVWSTSNSAVATVNNGVITFTGIGSATITATCGNYSATCAVSVDNILYSGDYTFGLLSNSSGKDYVTVSIPNNRRIIAADQVPFDTTKLVFGRSNTFDEFRVAPHVIPAGTKRISVSAVKLDSSYSFYLFFMASATPSTMVAADALMIEKNTQNGQNISVEYNVPSGADSIGCMIYANKTYESTDNPDDAAAYHEFTITFKGSAPSE